MFPQISAFFADLKLGIIKSSISGGVNGNGNSNGRKGNQNHRRTSTDGEDDDAQNDYLDDTRPMGYGCLGRRSTSMEYGLGGGGPTTVSKRRRRGKRSSRSRRRNGGSAQSLDRLSDRVYSAMSLMELSQQSTPGRPYGVGPNNNGDLSNDAVDGQGQGQNMRYQREATNGKQSAHAPASSTPRPGVTSSGQRPNRRVPNSATQQPPNSTPSSAATASSAAASSRRRVESWLSSPVGPGLPVAQPPNSLRRTDSEQSRTSVASLGVSSQPVSKTRGTANGGNGVGNGTNNTPHRGQNGNNNEAGAIACIPRTWSTPFDLASYLDDELAPSRRGGPEVQQPTTPTSGATKAKPFKRTPSDSGLNGFQKVPPTGGTTTTPVTNTKTPVTGSLVLRRRHGNKENNGQPVTGRAALRITQPQQPVLQDGALITDARHNVTYRKGRLLGKGGFAKCFEMTDIKNDKIFAGKVIAKVRLAKGNQKDKINREVDLHRHLRHKNVVGFFSYFEDDFYVYMMLELCSRKSLVHILKRRTTLTDPEVRFYMRQLVAGLRYIHSQRIIHRDLKLGNMLLSDSMELKIADFGLATKVEYEGEKKMTVCGTPNYIAPEVLQKRGHSYEADIWALGCIMYALLCGRPPFETATLKETYMRIVSNKFTIPPHVLRSARDLICRLLTVNPSDRPSLDNIDADNYFSDGHMPTSLDPSTCEHPPKFPVPSIAPAKARVVAFKNTTKETANKEPMQPSLAQTRGGRKYSSQIITRTNTPPNSETMGSLLRDGYPHQAGSAPSIAADVSLSQIKGLPPNSPLRLYRHLVACFDTCTVTSSTVTQISRPNVQCITKWVDYSNKYGFGFQLSDGSIGILFNDNTRMLLNADGRTIQYNDLSNRTHTFTKQSISNEHQKKVTLLMYFSEYMDTHLLAGSNIEPNGISSISSTTNSSTTAEPQTAKDEHSSSPIFMKKWFRTERAIVMYLSNGTLQVNFLDDHSKMVINPDGPRDYLITYFNSARHPTSYMLTALRHFGCTIEVLERLRYAGRMLERIIHVDGESV